MEWLLEAMFSVRSMPRLITRSSWHYGRHLCGGGFEYLHRDPASCRRRRKGKSQIWDSKNPRNITLPRASSIYKRQTRPLVRESAPQKQDRNCQTLINIWSWAPDGARHQDLLIDWPSVAMWLWFDLSFYGRVFEWKLGSWCEMVASLRGREPRGRGTSTTGRC
jgi:hypothetical protein